MAMCAIGKRQGCLMDALIEAEQNSREVSVKIKLRELQKLSISLGIEVVEAAE
jgi:hypothetical protein